MSTRRPDPARRAALELLRAVREDDAYANLAMPALLHRRGLSGRDAAFATELGYGTLRWQGWYDAILARCITRDQVDPDVLDVLRLGCHQLLHMRVPDHAAVSTSCDLAGASRAGFVNAVLRAVSRRSEGAWADELRGDRADDDPGWLAERWSHPAWIVRAFADRLGESRAELPALLAADNRPARPALVARPGRMTVAELQSEPGVEPGRWSPLAGILASGSPEGLASVRSGRAGVQDEGSQLVTLALAAVPVAGRDDAWLDACAGPGGKAAILAGLAEERGARLTCVEQHAHRARLVEQATGQPVLVGDARRAPWGDATFDRILLDAPCTGLGALRRRPEARWRRTPGDLPALGALQRDLLRTCAAALRPGGVLAYVTCSPHLAETEYVVRDILAAHDDLAVVDARDLLPGVPDLGPGPTVQLWPHRQGTDAMFLALLRRG
jgi:16S rRNA (cytosine967-C5)-methyltransferase